MDTKRIGRRIKAFRKLKGYTQLDLAEKMNIPIGVLGSVERGTKDLSKDLLKQISITLMISKDEIMLTKKCSEES